MRIAEVSPQDARISIKLIRDSFAVTRAIVAPFASKELTQWCCKMWMLTCEMW